MAVKVFFEVGHTSKLKSKQTPDGFTHDWELYVQGTEKNDISHFVEKVVFNLHESFPKPKRVLKDAPYVLKESGYAGFLVPTEIHFKTRDQQKLTFTYDLQLQNAGPPMHRNEIKKFTFNNPSEDFRRKLLKGGGISLVNNTADEKSRDSLDDRSQPMTKPKVNNDEMAKKHKIRPEESKLQTFAKLFGPPITKTTPKVSPETKTKSSPVTIVPAKGNKSSEKSSGASSTAKEKPEKVDKKDKHKHSPHKEKYEGKESKKSDEKHERREEKKKDKSHSKERDRSRDKNSKRPPSPKKIPPSPKRQSPVRSSSAASRGDTNGYKASTKPPPDPVTVNNNAEKLPTSSSSSGKKSKKEKKSYDKERDREKGKDKDRDRKDKTSDDRSSNNSTPVVPSVLPANSHNQSGAQNNNSKLPSNDVKANAEFAKNKEKEKQLVNSGSSKDTAKESSKKSNIDTSSNQSEPKKTAEKHEKDSEKRHKHKKKDKSKEKEKEKDHSSSKDSKKKEKSTKKDDLKKTPQVTNEVPANTSQKSNVTPLSTLLHGISDDDTRDSISESVSASVSERHESFAESSNSSATDNAAKAAAAAANIPHQPPPPPAPAPPQEEPKSEKKERKNRERVKTEKDEKKRKRKSKDDVDSASHKATPPPVLVPEPPLKQMKKDELIVKNGDRSNSPHLPNITSNSSIPNPSPKAQHIVDDSKAFRTPNAANVPLPSTSSSSINSNTSQTNNHPDRSFTVDYISELRDLQQKIMTLQDSNDLQQVVELIAPTGRFEITSKSFDFDLCTLDRITVQKLQDFFATSCS